MTLKEVLRLIVTHKGSSWPYDEVTSAQLAGYMGGISTRSARQTLEGLVTAGYAVKTGRESAGRRVESHGAPCVTYGLRTSRVKRLLDFTPEANSDESVKSYRVVEHFRDSRDEDGFNSVFILENDCVVLTTEKQGILLDAGGSVVHEVYKSGFNTHGQFEELDRELEAVDVPARDFIPPIRWLHTRHTS